MRRLILVAAAIVAASLGLGGRAIQQADAITTCTFTTIGTTMRLNANCTTDATILIPNGMTLDGRGRTITAVNPGVGHFLGAIVKAGGATANVKNLKLTTAGLADVCDAGDDRLRGILFDGASGAISENTVANINQGPSGCQEGNGIEVRNAPYDGTGSNPTRVFITENTVTAYQKTGILVSGNVKADIIENYVSGIGPVGSIAQNGIQVSYGATGTIRENKVTNNAYTGPNWSSTGILIFQSSNVLITRNEVKDSQIGIAIESWGCYAGGPAAASNNQVIYNKISGAEWGVSIAAYGWTPYSECQAEASNNKITNNSIKGIPGVGDDGIFIGSAVFAGPYVPVVDKNKATSNYIVGFDDVIDIDGATNTITAANGNDS